MVPTRDITCYFLGNFFCFEFCSFLDGAWEKLLQLLRLFQPCFVLLRNLTKKKSETPCLDLSSVNENEFDLFSNAVPVWQFCTELCDWSGNRWTWLVLSTESSTEESAILLSNQMFFGNFVNP